MADAHQLLVSPHNYNSTTAGLAATIQASAVMLNFLITEYFVNFADRGSEFCSGLELDNGCIKLPSAPGLGIEMYENAMRRLQPDSSRPVRAMGRFFED